MRTLFGGLALATALQVPSPAQGLSIYTENAPPNQFLDGEGRLTGFAVELVREIQKRTGNRDPIQLVPWIRGYRELETRSNVVLFSVARSAARDPLFQWVGPIGESSFAFFVKAGSTVTIRNLEDAKKLRAIGVYKEDARDQFLTKAGFINLDRSLDESVMLRKLMDGRIDAMVSAPGEGVLKLARGAGYRPEDLREAHAFQKVQTYIAFSKAASPGIVKAWSQALAGMKKDGNFEYLYRTYYPVEPLPGPEIKPF